MWDPVIVFEFGMIVGCQGYFLIEYTHLDWVLLSGCLSLFWWMIYVRIVSWLTRFLKRRRLYLSKVSLYRVSLKLTTLFREVSDQESIRFII